MSARPASPAPTPMPAIAPVERDEELRLGEAAIDVVDSIVEDALGNVDTLLVLLGVVGGDEDCVVVAGVVVEIVLDVQGWQLIDEKAEKSA